MNPTTNSPFHLTGKLSTGNCAGGNKGCPFPRCWKWWLRTSAISGGKVCSSLLWDFDAWCTPSQCQRGLWASVSCSCTEGRGSDTSQSRGREWTANAHWPPTASPQSYTTVPGISWGGGGGGGGGVAWWICSQKKNSISAMKDLSAPGMSW